MFMKLCVRNKYLCDTHFLTNHFAICGLVLFTLISNAKIVSYLKSILFLQKVTSTII